MRLDCDRFAQVGSNRFEQGGWMGDLFVVGGLHECRFFVIVSDEERARRRVLAFAQYRSSCPGLEILALQPFRQALTHSALARPSPQAGSLYYSRVENSSDQVASFLSAYGEHIRIYT